MGAATSQHHASAECDEYGLLPAALITTSGKMHAIFPEKRLQTLKLDYHPTDKDVFSLLPRRWWSDTRAFTCNTIGYGGDLPIFKNHYHYASASAVLNWTHTLNPGMVNEFGTGFTGEQEEGLPEAIFGRTTSNYFNQILRSTTGFSIPQFSPGANQYDILPQAIFNFVPGITGQPSLTSDPRLPDNQGYHRYHLTDNFTSWNLGKHTLKFGIYYERNWATDGPHANCYDGCFDFTHNVNNPLDTGWDFANADLGVFNSYQESNSRLPYQAENKMYEWFAQDTFQGKPEVHAGLWDTVLSHDAVVCRQGPWARSL